MHARRFNIKAPNLDTRLEFLSGGNQQKVSLAKSIDTRPTVLVADEPTRGVDVSAKQEIYRLINSLAAEGLACIFISSEQEEIIGMCHRVIVMKQGRVMGSLEGESITEEEIMFLATGNTRRSGVMETSAVARALKRFNYQKYSAFMALVVLFVVSAFLSPFFTRPGNLVNILSQVSYTGMISLGMALVIITGGIDLSVGSLVAFDSLVGVMVMNYVLGSIHNELVAIATGIVAALVLGAVTGLVNGMTITRGRIAPFIVTLGTMAIFRSLALFTGNAGEIQSQSNFYGEFGLATVLWLPVPVWVMLFLAFVLDIVLNRTRYGRYLCAVGSNTRVAVFSAINVDRVKVIAYTITGVLVAISSILLSSRFNAVSTSNTGMGYELDAIAAVIVGGTPFTGGRGTIWGTIIGAIILGIINNMLNLLGVSAYLQGTVKGLVIIGAVYIQRQRA